MQNKKYGEYGGQYVAESLMSVLAELETAYNEAINDPKFIEEYNYYLKEYVGRETPLIRFLRSLLVRKWTIIGCSEHGQYFSQILHPIQLTAHP